MHRAASTWDPPPIADRVAWLRRFRSLVAHDRDNLATLMLRDMGKPRDEAVIQDIVPLLASCRWHERHASRLLRGRSAGLGSIWNIGHSVHATRAPLGTVGIIATWNFPVQLLGIQLVQALIAGNRVVVKPSENAPRSQARLLDLAREAGVPGPPDTLTWTEPSRDAGPRLLRDGALDHVVFTGSTGVGRSIAEWAATTLTPTTLELSGRDSALVLSDADPALAAKSIWFAVTMNAGQTCMAPRRALVAADIYPEFLRHLAPLVAAAKPRDLVNPEAAVRVHRAAAESCTPARSARSLSGVLEPPQDRRITPIAVVDCRGDEPAVTGDHFGPLLGVVPVATLDEALAIHRRCPQHLATSIYSRDTRRARELAPMLGAGIVTINDTVVPTGHPALCISGRAESGSGFSRGPDGLLAMTRPVYVTRTSKLVRPPVEPMTSAISGALSMFAGWLYAGAGRPSNSAASPDVSPDELLSPTGPTLPDPASRRPAPAKP